MTFTNRLTDTKSEAKKQPLTGQELIDYVNNNQTLGRVELCSAAGYERNFDAFYEAIFKARQDAGEYPEPLKSGADWYDSLTDQDRELYDMIEDRCPEFEEIDAEQCQEFMDELSDLGITTAEQFEDALSYQTDSDNAEAEFAEYVTTKVNGVDIEKVTPGDGVIIIDGVIDWQETWDRAVCYDFSSIEFDDQTYFFSNDVEEVD